MDIAQLSYQVDSSDLDKANARLEKNEQAAKKAETASGRLTRVWQGMRRSLGALVSVQTLLSGALSAVTINAAKQINQLSMMSQQIGVTTEALSGMRYAAEQMANVSSGQFDMALRRMTRRIQEAAAGGGPAADALKRMGLSAQELARMAPDEQFRRFADAIKGTANQGDRLRNVMALMDTEGMPLVAMLQQGGDAIREVEAAAAELGLTIDRNTARAADAFSSQLTKLGGVKKGLTNQIASELMPLMSRMTHRFADSAQGMRGMEQAAKVAGAGLKIVASAGTIIVGIFKTVGEALGGVAAAVVSLLTGQFRQAWNITKDFSADIVGNVKQTAADVANIWDDTVVWDGEIIDGTATANALGQISDASDGAAKAADRLKEANDRAAASLRALDDAAIREEESRVRWMARIDDMVARVEGPVAVALLDFRRGMAELDAAFRSNLVSLEDYQRGAEAMGRTLGNVTAEMDTATGKISVSAEQAGRNIQSFLGQATYDVLDGSFRDIADSFSEMIKRMMAELAASKMLEMLGGWASGYSGAGSGWINQLGSILGGGRRHGGPVRRDRMYEVNEGGIPELLDTPQGRYLLPGSHGNVTPLAASAGGGGAMATPQININVAGNADVESATARQNPSGGFDIDVILRQVDSHIAGGIATGTGQTGRAMKSRYGLKEVV